MSLNQGQMLAVLNALPDPVFVLTASGCYAGLFGHADPNYYHDGSDLMGSRLHDVLPAEVADWVLSHVQQSLQENGLIKVEYPLSADQVKGLENQPGPDGMIWFEGHIQPFPGLIDNEPAVIWVARNITRRKILEEQLIEHSKTDPLTQAGNRRRLMEALDQVYADFRRYNRPAALIMFDIDHFKRLNDKFGHLAGDHVLQVLSQICQNSLRECDILARFGGEEFIIVLPETNAEQAANLAERLRTQVTEDVVRELGEGKAFSLSLGVSELLTTDTDVQQVLHRVDQALYQAKANGRNCVLLYREDNSNTGS